MSDEAISYVTKAIRELLLSRLKPNLVTLLPPGEDPPAGGSGVNLYLYRVNESPFLKNVPWPGNRSGEPPSPGPALSLELFYLMTPFGQQTTDEDMAHRVLGAAMLALFQNPVLNHAHVPGFDADTLPAAILDSFEDIKIRLHPISLDELSKIWSTIGKPYRLSIAYEVTLVQVTPTIPPSLSAGMVQTTKLDVITSDPPRLTRLEPVSGPLARLAAGVVTPTTLTVRGFGLTFPGEFPVVTVGDAAAAISGAPTQNAIAIVLPSGLSAGPEVDVRVRLHGRLSAALTFKVAPWISSLSLLRTALDVPGQAVVVQGQGLSNAVSVRADRDDGLLTWTANVVGGGTSASVSFNTPAGSQSNVTATGAAPGNGFYALRVVLPGSSLTNPRVLEVIPSLTPVTGAAGGSTYNSATRALTLKGARLDGNAVRLAVDDHVYDVGTNPNGAQIAYTFGRKLSPGSHHVSVNVDGHTSHEIVVTG